MNIQVGDEEKETLIPVSATHATDRPKSDAAIDFWLKHHLSQLYGPVIDNPISEDLIKRLEACLG